jgi:hypothetical protein
VPSTTSWTHRMLRHPEGGNGSIIVRLGDLVDAANAAILG